MTDGSVLYLCPACGALVKNTDARCAKCGTALSPEPEHLPTPEAEAVDEVRLLEDLERALRGEKAPPPPPLAGEITEETRAQKRVLLTFLSAIPEVSQPAIGAIAGFFPNLYQISLADEEDLRAIPNVKSGEAHRVKGAVDRFVKATERELPAPTPAKPRKDVRAPPAAPPKSTRLRLPAIVPTTRGAPRPTREPRFAVWRDAFALATLAAVPAGVAALWMAVPGYDVGLLFLFGALFGIGVVLIAPRTAARERGGKMLHEVSPFLTWLAGLLLLTLAAVVALAPTTEPRAGFMLAVWAVGGVLAMGPAGFVAYRRLTGYLANGRLTRAEAALARREHAKAIDLYDEALALADRAALPLDGALHGKGTALVALGRHEEALAILDRALAENPGNEVAWVNKGAALSRLGRWRDALRCYNSAIKVNPAYEVAWNNKGNALSRLGNHEGSLRCYDRALALDTTYRTAWVNKGYVLAKLGRFKEAARCADAALRLAATPPA